MGSFGGFLFRSMLQSGANAVWGVVRGQIGVLPI